MHTPQAIVWDYGMRPLQQFLAAQMPQLRVPAGLASTELYDWLARHSSDPTPGLQLGHGYRVTDYGPVSLAILSARNLGQALQVAVAHLPDFNPHVAQMGVAQRHGETVVEVHFRPALLEHPASHRFHANVMAAATLQLVADLVGPRRCLRSISLPLQSPHPAYAAYFRVPVSLQGATVRFHFEGDLLEWPIPTANAATFEAALQWCGNQLNARLEQAVGGTAQRVAQLLASCPQQLPGMEAVAEHLHICDRTLRRRLAAEGTSYRALLEDAQWLRAQGLLRHPTRAVAHISAQLGMANPATLRAMVQRRTGLDIGAYRQQLGAGDRPPG